MDNDGFKDLVHGRIQGKTSKQIAREAVEDEFRRSKRKRGGPKGGNDDYSSSDDDDNENRNKKSKHASKDSGALSRSKREEDDEVAEKNKELASKYRDRAKERREAMEQIAGKHGGEKKGLDMELVRKRRREILQQQGRSLREPQKGDDEAEGGKFESIVSSKTIDEAIGSLSRLIQSRVSGNDGEESSILCKRVGSEILDYIEQVLHHHSTTTSKSPDGVLATTKKSSLQGHGNKPTAMRASTFLAFTLYGHPSDKARSWESPRVFTTHHGRRDKNLDGDDGRDSCRHTMATPIDNSLIRTMGLVLARNHDKEVRDVGSNKISGDPSSNAIQAMPKPKASSSASATKSTGANVEAEEDDDDIFGDAGDYIPPSARTVPSTHRSEVGLEPVNSKATKDVAKSSSVTKKASIFSGLVASGQSEAEAKKIDGPDIVDDFVANLYSRLQKRGGDSKPEQAYGDEMDVDFDGRLADQEEEDGGGDDEADDGKQKRKKKKRNDETTVAAKEYGSSRGLISRETD